MPKAVIVTTAVAAVGFAIAMPVSVFGSKESLGKFRTLAARSGVDKGNKAQNTTPTQSQQRIAGAKLKSRDFIPSHFTTSPNLIIKKHAQDRKS